MQGLEDKIVPPSQAEAIVAALAANGIPHAYLAFEGEGHGFRGAAAIRRALEAELSFLGPGLRLRAGRRRSIRSRCPVSRRGAGVIPAVDRRRLAGARFRTLIELNPIELVLGLLVVAIALAYLARRIGVSYPILLVLGGLALGFLPGLPPVELEPEVVFLLLLPPILFGAGYSTPIRDFKANARPIALLAIGLVLFTTAAVGIVANALVPELGIAAALALGAIVAPPDAVAATSIFQRLHVPPRIVTILEGESLINDASALIAYRFAVMAARRNAVHATRCGARTSCSPAAGGVIVGLVVGFIVTEFWRRTSDPTLEIMVSLVAPFAAYLAGRGRWGESACWRPWSRG